MDFLPLVLRIGIGVFAALGTAVFVLSKCFFLAPSPLGRVMWASSLVYEIIWKKLGWKRHAVDGGLFVALVPLWLLAGGPWAALAFTLLMAVAWGWSLNIDLRWRSGALAHQDSRYANYAPVPVPRLTLTLMGPVVDRGPVCRLGHWPVGHEASFEAYVLNPSLVPPQFPMRLEVVSDSDRVQVLDCPEGDLRAPDPEGCERLAFRLRAVAPGGPCEIRVRLEHADHESAETLRLDSVQPEGGMKPAQARITRWKGGSRSAFGWRGDHDMYDPATFQDARGLEMALGLARRFCMPSTVYLSARLSLVEEEHKAFSEHHGWDRRTEQIPDFIRFLREDVEMTPLAEWPQRSERPYFAEFGNHMYHHYGTHASAAAGNSWKKSSIGAGDYPWLGPEKDDLSEQRDNAAKCNEVFKEVLGWEPMSFAVPGRDYSENTPAAVEAAGIPVGSDSDASQWLNVMGLPRPHHPKGVKRLVDITKKYPGDCDNAYKIAMLKYWMHLARREGSHFLYMAHQHLVRYFDNACYHLTEEMLRYVLGDCHGDFWVATVSSMAMYWENVLCPEHRIVKAVIEDGRVVVANTGEEDLDHVPVEVETADGKGLMVLVDVPAGQSVTVDL